MILMVLMNSGDKRDFEDVEFEISGGVLKITYEDGRTERPIQMSDVAWLSQRPKGVYVNCSEPKVLALEMITMREVHDECVRDSTAHRRDRPAC